MISRRVRPTHLEDSPEHRSIPIDSFALEESSDDTLVLRGYASTFRPYEMYGGPSNGYGWIERIDPGAFERTLKEGPDLHLLINHEGLPLARTKSDNLDLSVDEGGLRVVARLDRTDPDVQRLEAKMRPRPGARPLMDEMSFAFRVKSQKWEATTEFPDDPEALRTITEVSLHKGDVSVVNFGANPTTSVSIDRAISMLATCDKRELAELRDGVRQSTVQQALEALEGLAGKAESRSEEGAEDQVVEDETEARAAVIQKTLPDGVMSPAEVREMEARADADDDAASLIAALDAALDEATNLIADVDREALPENVAQALDLLCGAETIVDKLMEVSGIYDPDDDDEDMESGRDMSDEDVEKREDQQADSKGITIPIHAEPVGIDEFAARIATLEALLRTLTGTDEARVHVQVGAGDEVAAPTEVTEERNDEESTEETRDEEEMRDETPQGMSLREALALQGIVPSEGALSLAEAKALIA